MWNKSRKGKGLSKKKGTTLFTLVIIVALIIIFFYVQFQIFYPSPQVYEVGRGKNNEVLGFVPELKSEKGMFLRLNENIPSQINKKPQSDRTLSGLKKNRAYYGAPPSIPHNISTSMVDGLGVSCLECHKSGGFSPQYNAYAPVTPHPEMISCRQCHVLKGSSQLFKKIDWRVSLVKPSLGESALIGSPPTIPHSLQMRENCLSCHSGPAAIAEIKVSHPERVNCRQCHVVSKAPVVFKRKK